MRSDEPTYTAPDAPGADYLREDPESAALLAVYEETLEILRSGLRLLGQRNYSGARGALLHVVARLGEGDEAWRGSNER